MAPKPTPSLMAQDRTLDHQARMRRNRQAGLTIPLVAVSLVVFIILMALAIDLGMLYTARTSAQHAADAAALAGAFTFVTNPTPSASSATSAAQQAALNDSILGTAIKLSEVTVSPPQLPSSTQPGRVTVQISRTIPTAFARAFGLANATVTTGATAEAAAVGTSTSCLRPFWVYNSQGQFSGNVCTNPLILSNGQPNPAINLSSGYPLQLHTSNTPSQWGLIQVGGNPSGAAIRSAIGACDSSGYYGQPQIACGTVLGAAPGNKVGPVKQGVQAIWATEGSPPDSWIGPGRYQTQNGVSDVSNSVVAIAIFDDCCPGCKPASPGNGSFPVAGFGQVFINSMTGNNINAYLINYSVCGSGGGGGAGAAGGNSGSYAVPVRLIH